MISISDAAEAVNRAITRAHSGDFALPLLLVKHIANDGGRKLCAILMLWRARISLRVLLQPLDQADHAVDLAADTVER